MFVTTVESLCKHIGEDPRGVACGNATVAGVSIDSRHVTQGDLFLAMPGTRTHGDQFARDAIQAGACAVVSENACPTESLTSHWLQTQSVLRFLEAAAAWNRSRSQAEIIGITGSVGKTTTRQLISCVLSGAAPGIQSQANYNNHLGVPLTLLRLAEHHEWAAVEMGASQTGEIAALARIAQPSTGVVTSVAAAHLEGFGSIDAIQKGKQELAEALPFAGTLFLNADDARVLAMKDATSARVVTFGQLIDADLQANNVTWENQQLAFTVSGTTFRVNASGKQVLTSVLAAIAVSRNFGMPDSEIAERLQEFLPAPGRGRLVRTAGVTIVDESYNASPVSVKAAIATASQPWPEGRRILVLGDMLELGEQSRQEHEGIGVQLASSTIDHIFITGQFSAVVSDAAIQSGLASERITTTDSLSCLSRTMARFLRTGDLVVVKGSRGNRLDRCIAELSQLLTSADVRHDAA